MVPRVAQRPDLEAWKPGSRAGVPRKCSRPCASSSPPTTGHRAFLDRFQDDPLLGASVQAPRRASSAARGDRLARSAQGGLRPADPVPGRPPARAPALGSHAHSRRSEASLPTARLSPPTHRRSRSPTRPRRPQGRGARSDLARVGPGACAPSPRTPRRPDRARAGLRPWSAGMDVCLFGGPGPLRPRPRGDLGLIKLCSSLRGRRAEVEDTRELLAPYGEWAGLASGYLLSGGFSSARRRADRTSGTAMSPPHTRRAPRPRRR